MVQFSDTIEASHRRPTVVTAGEFDSSYLGGDPHGYRDERVVLCEKPALTESDLVVFVGDLVRKAPNSKRVVDLGRESSTVLTPISERTPIQ